MPIKHLRGKKNDTILMFDTSLGRASVFTKTNLRPVGFFPLFDDNQNNKITNSNDHHVTHSCFQMQMKTDNDVVLFPTDSTAII